MTTPADDDLRDPMEQAYTGLFRRVWRGIALLLSIPLWIGVLFGGIGLLAAWTLPVRLTPTSSLQQMALAASMFFRVFQFHIGLAALVAFAGAVVLRRGRLALVAMCLAAPVLAAELWRALPDATRPEGTGPALRIAAMNVYAFNGNLDAIEAQARRIDADVLVIEEYNVSVHTDLERRLRDLYPHQSARPDWGTKGKAIFTKAPHRYDGEHPNAEAEGRRRYVVDFAGEEVAVYIVHHRSPGGVDEATLNGEQTAGLVAALSNESLPAVYLGDFNASPWTPQLTALRKAGLREAFDECEFGRGGTWPGRVTRYRDWLAHVIPMGLGVRIDNIFLQGGLVAENAGVGQETRSDHRPVWADLRRVR